MSHLLLRPQIGVDLSSLLTRVVGIQIYLADVERIFITPEERQIAE